jgi:hypothetical protein
VGLAWNLQPVPPRIYEEARHGATALGAVADGTDA